MFFTQNRLLPVSRKSSPHSGRLNLEKLHETGEKALVLYKIQYMGLIIPDNIIEQSDMTPDELLLEFAVFLYQRERLSLAQAARLAGLDRIVFQQALTERHISLNFGIEDLQQELDIIEKVKDDYRQRHLSNQ